MKIMMTAFMLWLVLPVLASAQEFDRARLGRYFDALEQGDRFMGSVALSRNGKLLYTRALGMADLEKGIKARPDSRYRIGSISKTFTATLALLAVEEGKLVLEQTIESFFPALPNAGRITVAQLLGHRSGIHSFTDDKDYLSWNTRPRSREEMVALIARGDSEFEPGSKGAYSNSNYVLLTFILEKVFETPYSDLLVERIAGPLGLKDTRLGDRIDPGRNECRSYSYQNGWRLEPETDPSIPLGAGGVVSTATDLVRFADALLGGKILRPESLQRMKTIVDGYGLGLFTFPFNGKKAYGHTGGIDGFSSVFSHFEKEGVSCALVSNGTRFDNNAISIALLSAVFGQPYEIPGFETYPVKPEELDRYLGSYSSTQIPLKITVSRKGDILTAQAEGQSAFELEATGKDRFAFAVAGIEMIFDPKNGSFVLKQGGGSFLFTRQ